MLDHLFNTLAVAGHQRGDAAAGKVVGQEHPDTVVLRFYNSFASGTLLDHFHYTFITIGGITMMAAFVFMLLRKDDGDSLLPGRKKPVFETTSSSTPRNP